MTLGLCPQCNHYTLYTIPDLAGGDLAYTRCCIACSFRSWFEPSTVEERELVDAS